MTKENVPILIIKKQYFDEIINGTKTEEYRSLNDHYFKMFWHKGADGVYDRKKDIRKIQLANGYSKNRRVAVLEVKGIFIDRFENFLPEGFEKGDECFTIELGKVLSKNF